MKNKKLLNSFVDYCLKHPNERFWQALRNWSGQKLKKLENEDNIK